MTHYDLFVIGGGSGGVAAARASAAHGAKVGIAEGDKYGGTCVNRGCMPKKWYMYASHCQDEFTSARSLGWEFEAPRLNWQTLKTNTVLSDRSSKTEILLCKSCRPRLKRGSSFGGRRNLLHKTKKPKAKAILIETCKRTQKDNGVFSPA